MMADIPGFTGNLRNLRGCLALLGALAGLLLLAPAAAQEAPEPSVPSPMGMPASRSLVRLRAWIMNDSLGPLGALPSIRSRIWSIAACGRVSASHDRSSTDVSPLPGRFGIR